MQARNVTFRGRPAAPTPPESPVTLFRNLPRTGKGVGGLWTHQGAILDEYVGQYTGVSDVALELPTGTGKTLPGLLIADWSRLSRSERAAYACPTQQLARQVHEAAGREGIKAVLLIGSHGGWHLSDVTRYDAA